MKEAKLEYRRERRQEKEKTREGEELVIVSQHNTGALLK